VSVNTKGFTLVELLISISLIGILSVSVLAATTNYFAIITRNNTFVDMTADSQNLLRLTAEELRYGAGVRQTNTIVDPSLSTGWNTGNTNFVIIIAVPALDGSRNYIIDPLTGNPYLNELVYYKQATTLFRRTLAHPDATGNRLATSCPPGSATASCPADRLLIENAKAMTFNLYDQDDLPTTLALAARSIKINLSLEKTTYAGPLKLDNSIRVTLRNKF